MSRSASGSASITAAARAPTGAAGLRGAVERCGAEPVMLEEPSQKIGTDGIGESRWRDMRHGELTDLDAQTPPHGTLCASRRQIATNRR